MRVHVNAALVLLRRHADGAGERCLCVNVSMVYVYMQIAKLWLIPGMPCLLLLQAHRKLMTDAAAHDSSSSDSKSDSNSDSSSSDSNSDSSSSDSNSESDSTDSLDSEFGDVFSGLGESKGCMWVVT